MKGKQVLDVFLFVMLTLLALYIQPSYTQEHGKACGPNDYCAINLGLICSAEPIHANTCQCGNSSGPAIPEYIMKWNGVECVGIENGACYGTEANPVPAEMRSVRCDTGLTCEQIDTQPPGVGTCVKQDEGSSTPGESSTGGDSSSPGEGEESTTPSDSKAGTLAATNGFFIAVLIFVHLHQ